jgi:hypothetical protein
VYESRPLKLVSYKGSPPELFDLVDDPGESKDLSASRPEDVARLRGRWEVWDAELQVAGWR